jgi:nitrogen PTS system EIIA component
MKIMDFLCSKAITTDLKAVDKNGVLKELTDLLVSGGVMQDTKEIVKALQDRELLGSTGIGHGVAIPHGKCLSVKKLTGAFGISSKGVRFDALDGEPVYIFFLLVAPEESSGPHLKALARISRLLRDKFFRDSLTHCKTAEEMLRIVQQQDERQN